MCAWLQSSETAYPILLIAYNFLSCLLSRVVFAFFFSFSFLAHQTNVLIVSTGLTKESHAKSEGHLSTLFSR